MASALGVASWVSRLGQQFRSLFGISLWPLLSDISVCVRSDDVIGLVGFWLVIGVVLYSIYVCCVNVKIVNEYMCLESIARLSDRHVCSSWHLDLMSSFGFTNAVFFSVAI